MRNGLRLTPHNLAFLLALLLLLGLAWQGFRTQQTLLSTNTQVVESLEVITATQEMLSALQDVETGERGYVITGNATYLVPYETSLERLDEVRLRLEQTIENHGLTRQGWLERLDAAIGKRLQISADNILVRREEGLEAAAARLAVAGGRQVMDRLRDLLGELETLERQRLAEERQRIELQVTQARLQIVVVGLLIILLLVGAWWAVHRSLRERQRLMVQAKTSESRLRDQQAFLRNVVDTDDNLIFVREAEGRFSLCNQAFAQLFDAQPTDIEGRLPQEVGLTGGLMKLLEGDEALWRSEASVLRIPELHVVYRNGESRWLQLIKRPMTFYDGSRQVLTVAVDISARHQMDRMKAEFTSTVSHELRTPLTAIRGALGMLTGGLSGEVPAEMRPLLEIAHKNSERLIRLINDILDIEKLEADRLPFDLKPVAVRLLVKQALQDNAAYAREYDVALTLIDPADDGLAMLDTDRFAQVMANLLSNAIKHSPPGGKVEVAIEQHSSTIEISVSDHGPGIAESFRHRVFERFAQADSSDARRRGGTGLGLAITKSLVERLGGEIGFETEIGLGTRFYVRLPRVEQVEPDFPARLLDGPRILIADDDASSTQQLSDILEAQGYAIRVATSIEQAREYLETSTIHTLVISPVMPDGDGLAFVHALREQPAYRHLPVVLLGVEVPGKSTEQGPVRGGAVGLFDWLDKPLDTLRVVEAVRTCLRASGTRARLLHVEDDPDLRDLLVNRLAGEDIDVYSAASLQAAREALSQRHHDLAVLDLELPDGNGVELLEELGRTSPPTPVIIFSVHDVAPEDTARVILRRLVKSRSDGNELADLICEHLHFWPPRALPDSSEEPS